MGGHPSRVAGEGAAALFHHQAARDGAGVGDRATAAGGTWRHAGMAEPQRRWRGNEIQDHAAGNGRDRATAKSQDHCERRGRTEEMTGRKKRLSWRSGHVGGKRGLLLGRALRDTVWYGSIHDCRKTRAESVQFCAQISEGISRSDGDAHAGVLGRDTVALPDLRVVEAVGVLAALGNRMDGPVVCVDAAPARLAIVSGAAVGLSDSVLPGLPEREIQARAGAGVGTSGRIPCFRAMGRSRAAVSASAVRPITICKIQTSGSSAFEVRHWCASAKDYCA